MSLKQEAASLLKIVQDQAQKIPENQKSAWIATEEVARVVGIDKGDIKKLLRRPRVRQLLGKAGIAAAYRGEFVYVYRQSTFGKDPINDTDLNSADDDSKAPETPKVTDEWGLDPNYFWLPPYAEDIETAADAGMNIFLVGPAGSGKSSLLRQIFKSRGSNPIVIGFTGEVSVDDLVGGKDLVNGQTVFTEGVLPIAMRKGTPLIIDEADATPPDVQFVLHPVLMGEPLLLTKKGAEYVNPEIGFLIAATGNTLGRGDDSGLYVGTNVLNEAYIDRYGMVIDHWYMPEHEETKVLVKRTGIHKKTAEMMVRVATLARDAMRAEKLSSTFSTRKLLDWAKLVVRDMSVGRAYTYTCIAKVSRDDKKAIAEFGQRVFGTSFGVDPKVFA